MRLADKPPQRILREAGAPLRRGWRPYGRSRQAGGQLLLPSRVRRREHETPAPDPLETGEVHIVHDDHPRCKADFRADRVSQRSCRADRCPMVRESLDEFPIPVCKEAIDREFTSHRIGSAPDCHCARGEWQPARTPLPASTLDDLRSSQDGNLPHIPVTPGYSIVPRESRAWLTDVATQSIANCEPLLR